MRSIFNILFKTVQYWNDRVCSIRMTWPSTIIDYHRQQSEGRICFTSNGQYWSTNIEAQRALLSWANSIKFSDQQISLNNSKVWKEKQNFEQFGPKSGFARLSRQEHTHTNRLQTRDDCSPASLKARFLFWWELSGWRAGVDSSSSGCERFQYGELTERRIGACEEPVRSCEEPARTYEQPEEEPFERNHKRYPRMCARQIIIQWIIFS